MRQQKTTRRVVRALAAPVPESDPRRRTIVFINDSHTIMRAATMACENSYQIVFVSLGGIVGQVVDRWYPDLVVVDELPEATGYDLCRELRSMKATSEVPIVLLWGESTPYDEALGREARVTHNLRKPFDSEHALETFRALLDGDEPPGPEGPPWPEPIGVDERPESKVEADMAEGTVDFQELVDEHAEVLEDIIAEHFQGMDTVPAKTAEPVPHDDKAPSLRIFMFESDRALVRVLKRQLEVHNIILDSTDDPNVGLARVTEEPPDMILLTVELDSVNGFAICNDLKKSPQHSSIPVVLLSSEVSEETFERHRKLRTRADDYLRKPFEFPELMLKVKELLDERRSSVPPGPDSTILVPGEDGPRKLGPEESSDTLEVLDEVSVELDISINEQWLIVLWSSDPTVRGKRFNITNTGDLPDDVSDGLWLENLVSVGRSALNKVVIDDPRVSGWHFRIQRKDDTIVLSDLKSEHGTWVNDRRVLRAELQGGEVIRVGGTVMKFINDQYLSASFEDIIREFSEREWPSGAIKKHVIIERLEEATLTSSRAGSSLSVMAIFIDGFRQLSNELGVLDHSWILEEFALLLRAKFGDRELGRNVEGGFLVLLPGLKGEEAERLAGELRKAVEHREIRIRRRKIKLSVSIGVIEWSPGLSIRETILHANALAYKAQQTGGNSVALECVSNGSMDDRSCRAVPDAEWVLRKVLATEHLRPMVAFELDDERGMLERYGPDGWTTWLDKLVQEVLSATRPGDLVGTWKDRYVIAALDSGRGAERVCERVLSFWERFRGGGETGLLGPVTVRSAALSASDVGRHGPTSLIRLTEKLLISSRNGSEEWCENAPFPLAVAASMAPSMPPQSAESLLWSTEVVMRFLAAVLFSGLRQRDTGKAQRRLRAILRATPTPLEIAFDATPVVELAQLAKDEDDTLLRPLARLLVSRAGRRLLKRANEVGRAARDGEAKSVVLIVEALEALVQKVSLRLECEMFSVAEIVDFSDEGEIIYNIRRHQGPGEVFPIERAAFRHQLRKDWCYLKFEGEPRPLSLSPLIATLECNHCGRVEVFVGSQLQFTGDPEGVVMRGAVSGHEERFVSSTRLLPR